MYQSFSLHPTNFTPAITSQTALNPPRAPVVEAVAFATTARARVTSPVTAQSLVSFAAATAMKRVTSPASAPSPRTGLASSAPTVISSVMGPSVAPSLSVKMMPAVTGAMAQAIQVLQVAGSTAEEILVVLQVAGLVSLRRPLRATGLMSPLPLPTVETPGLVMPVLLALGKPVCQLHQLEGHSCYDGV